MEIRLIRKYFFFLHSSDDEGKHTHTHIYPINVRIFCITFQFVSLSNWAMGHNKIRWLKLYKRHWGDDTPKKKKNLTENWTIFEFGNKSFQRKQNKTRKFYWIVNCGLRSGFSANDEHTKKSIEIWIYRLK